jgi:DNA-binding XRE family transcriptional regulator
MKTLHLENIHRLLELGPVYITVQRLAYPPHWRSGQRFTGSPQSIGFELWRKRMELRLLQAELAKGLGVSAVTISNWERGVSQPSRRIQRRIRGFLEDIQDSTLPQLEESLGG